MEAVVSRDLLIFSFFRVGCGERRPDSVKGTPPDTEGRRCLADERGREESKSLLIVRGVISMRARRGAVAVIDAEGPETEEYVLGGIV